MIRSKQFNSSPFFSFRLENYQMSENPRVGGSIPPLGTN